MEIIGEEQSNTNILILNEYMGEDLEEICESYLLIMNGLEKIQKKNMGKLRKKVRKSEDFYVERVKECKRNLKREEIEMKRELENILDQAIQDNQDLIELNKNEKKSRKIIEIIFDIVRSWTDIDSWFSHLLGMREALIAVEESSSSCDKEEVTSRIRQRMMKKAVLIQKLHDFNKDNLSKVLNSINETMDFVEFGVEDANRTGIVMALNSMKNIPFWILKNEDTIDSGIDHIKETVFEIRDILFQLPLYLLRPRRSIRQILWQEIDSFERNDLSDLDFEKS